ncbi:hypothetical protein [Paraburkholderia sp.]|uniref:hypothetical protein n=1 Tax=Paraburkholderia sp. TaxID=1926495 RepID=UPI003C7DF948
MGSGSKTGGPPETPLQPISTPTPASEPASTSGDDGVEHGPSDAATVAQDETLLTDYQTGASDLLSTAFSFGISDPFGSTQDGWTSGSQDVNPYTGVATADGSFSACVGQNVDPFTGGAAGEPNLNAFTGGQNVDALTGASNAQPYDGGAGASPSPLLGFGVEASIVSAVTAANAVNSASQNEPVSSQAVYDATGAPYGIQYFYSDGTSAVYAYGNSWGAGPNIFDFPPINISESMLADGLLAQPDTPTQAVPQAVPTPTPPTSPATTSAPSPEPTSPVTQVPPPAALSNTPPPTTAAQPAPQPGPTQDQPVPSSAPSVTTSQLGPGKAPYDPMADSPIAKWLLYGRNTPILDIFTNDANLRMAQNTALGISGAAAVIATGGLAIEAAPGVLGGLGASTAGSASVTGLAPIAAAAAGVVAVNPQLPEEVEEGLEGTLPALGPGLGNTLSTAGEAAGAGLQDIAGALNPAVQQEAADEVSSVEPQITNAASQLRTNAAGGRAFQAAVNRFLGVEKNNPAAIFGQLRSGGYYTSVPDILNKGMVADAKDVIRIYFSAQLQAQYNVAVQSGVPFSLIVSPRNEVIYQPVIDAVRNSGGIIVSLDPILNRITSYLDFSTGQWITF